MRLVSQFLVVICEILVCRDDEKFIEGLVSKRS